MASHLLPERHEEVHGNNLWQRFLRGFEAGFEGIRKHYVSAVTTFIEHRGLSLTFAALMIVGTIPLLYVTGEDFFPTVDAGLMKFHVRAPSGTRIERTQVIVDDIERSIRQIIPADELLQISDDIDLPQPYAIAFFPTDNIGPQDGEILIQLKPNHHPTAGYQQRIREMMSTKFPNIQGYFMAADIVNQVLNFGLPAAIDAQINGNDLHSDYNIATRLAAKMALIPGVTDMRIAEPLDYPSFKVKVDRAKALELGVTEQQVASGLLSSLSGNTLISPNYWLDPVNGVNYNVVTPPPIHVPPPAHQIPHTPLPTTPSPQPVQFLGNVASISHANDPAVVAHYTVQRVIDVDCGVSGRDLGSTPAAVQKAIASPGPLPAATHPSIPHPPHPTHQS